MNALCFDWLFCYKVCTKVNHNYVAVGYMY